jgi:oxygen-independent coproporphyrinogen-3 oxidase
MLEVDEDSRLGRELIAGGSRYHAHHVPDSELAADLYLEAIEFLGKAGLIQYEISNFARPGRESRHNLKYWRREPYLGFGLDAHSMLLAETPSGQVNCVRFGRVDDLEMYLAGSPVERFQITEREAAEEYFFLGLRLNCGVELARIPAHFRSSFEPQLDELIGLGLLERVDDRVRLTSRGRLLSNEVFQQFVLTEAVT